MNTARFSQFHDVWGNKWSFCSEEKETGTTISSRILYWVPLPYEIDTGTLCILQTRLFHSAWWSGWNHLLVNLRLVCSTIIVKFYVKNYDCRIYWHLKFLLQIAPKRGWHLCIWCCYTSNHNLINYISCILSSFIHASIFVIQETFFYFHPIFIQFFAKWSS